MDSRTGDSSRADTAVVLPGTGSDAQFAMSAFGRALASVSLHTIAVTPDPHALVAGYHAALDAAARRHSRIVVGGISIGAAVAVSWSLRHPDSVSGLLLALPAWTGAAAGSPAALSASMTATLLREHGLTHVTESMTESSPAWLSATLTRSWASQWPDLPDALDEAAAYTGPSPAELGTVDVPTVVVGALDDPIHPIEVARQWAGLIPGAYLDTVTLAEIGTDPGILGNRCLGALTRNGQFPSC